MFINDKKNWKNFRDAAHRSDERRKATDKMGVVQHAETVTNDLLREIERVVNNEPSEGNFTPLIVGNIMAFELTSFVIDTTLSIINKRKLKHSDVADIAAVVAHDYTIALANLAYQKIESTMIERQINEIAV